MFAYVLFTVFLYQKGSSESKKPGELEPVDREPKSSSRNVPWPVRKGRVILKVYENSLSLAFLFLFLISFSLHATAGASLYSQEQQLHGSPPAGLQRHGRAGAVICASAGNQISGEVLISSLSTRCISVRTRRFSSGSSDAVQSGGTEL